jgi:hypothetical protein
MKAYAGIGSRSTTPELESIMTAIAAKLETEGWVLRSGGASGSDSAFERGVFSPANKEIYFPSASFNNRSANEEGVYNASTLSGWADAIKTVDVFHPAPGHLSAFAIKLMARNAMQVFGGNMDSPVKMVVAYTKDGKMTGGTSQALRIAQHYNIPIRNLGDKDTLESIKQWLTK